LGFGLEKILYRYGKWVVEDFGIYGMVGDFKMDKDKVRFNYKILIEIL
jgi:hypothetical protein